MIELEQSILGQFILYPETHVYIMRLNPLWFTQWRQKVITTMQTLYIQNNPVNLANLARYNKEHLYEIAQLQNIVTTTIYIEKEITTLEVNYKKNQIINRMAQFDYERELTEIINEMSLIVSEASIVMGSKPSAISSVAGHVIDELHEAIKRGGEITGIKTGWQYLDTYLGGWHEGNVITIGARPGVGKTAIALTFAINCSKWANVLFISLEMSKEEIAKRYLSFIGDVENYKIRSANLSEDNLSDLTNRLYSNEIDFYIDDSPNNDIFDIMGRIKLHKAKYGLNIVFIDYLQLIKGHSKVREQEISQISRLLKLLAKELNITIINLAQLSRESEKRGDKRPMLSDLRESGGIEQDSDVVIFPFRPAMYETEKPSIEMDAELIIAKNRHGSVGSIPLTYEGKFTRFNEQLL